MIKLEVEEYCQNCESFEPDTTSDADTSRTFEGFPAIKIVNTTVTCRYQKRCRMMVRYLGRKLKNDVE